MKTIVRFFLLLGLVVASTCICTFSQVAISTDDSEADQSAMLEIKSANKGVLIPRMTHAQLSAIPSPANGLMVFCTDCGSGALAIYTDGKWNTFNASCLVPSSPASGIHLPVGTQITWNWNTVPFSTGYKWNTTNSYAGAEDLGSLTTKTETGLACNQAYTRYIWAWNSCGESLVTTLTQATNAPAAPASGTNLATPFQITWTWNSVTGATGYKWNSVNNFGTASDMGTAVTKTESGLNCNTAYTRFAWAYNGCGNSTAVTLTQSTLSWNCGDPITINHLAGAIAPVDKIVTYETVTNIPGESSKCWITSNLGADHQATAVTDATEASAGWYWQFNRKQGFKHDGTTRTPGTAWIESISEGSNWQSANDPCALEVGTGWRIPTISEWINIDAGGGWVNYNDTWSSNLKIHAAGYMWWDDDGPLMYRGSKGYYWSSTQYDNPRAWHMDFQSGGSNENPNWYKSHGFSVRCLRDAQTQELPAITTTSVSGISQTTAISGGTVTNDGGPSVTARGVCWSTSSGPTTADSHTTNGSGTGTFVSSLTGLTAGTPYYVRAYATNSEGTSYGDEVSFSTLAPVLPTVTTTSISIITKTSATGGGNVTADGGAGITSKGVCWSTSSGPTIANDHTDDGSGTGSFTSSLSGLAAGTLYYVSSYATNSAGTAYGSEISFTTYKSDAFTDIDGNYYNIVTIGSQTWTAENLKTTKFKDGSAIPNVTADAAWTALSTPAYCWYNNNEAAYKAIYGAYYNWYTVSTGNLCPTGWHVPGDAEWTALSDFLGGSDIAGGKLKETGTAHWLSPNSGATNSTGFTGLAGGLRDYFGHFVNIPYYGYFWSSTESSSSLGWSRALSYDHARLNRDVGNYDKRDGFSIRCLKDELPSITTAAVTNISQTSATSGGNVTSDGGATVTARGVCWSTSSGPVATGNHTSDETGTGTFASNMTGLTQGTLYYVRAYATNSVGTSYGDEVTFTTLTLPTVTTAAVTEVTQISASCGGNVTSDGGSAVTVRGVCWNTSPNPETTNNFTTDGSGTGSFVSNLTGLTANTVYYVRAYATNSVGTAYGNEFSFKTYKSDAVSDIDGNYYNIVTIGTQTWMAENLKTTKYNDNTPIPLVTDATAWVNLTTPGYCWYNNDETIYGSTYGALYNWYVVNTGNLCPTEWHVPSDAEWTILTAYMGGEAVAGGPLKETGTTHWNSPNTGATNTSGFTGLPGGYRHHALGNFAGLGTHGNFWATTEYDATRAWYRDLQYNYQTVYRSYPFKNDGIYVRCLMDAQPTVTTSAVTNIGQTTATCGGNVTSDGGAPVTARGVCWSTSTNPTTANDHSTDASGTGTFTSSLTGLTSSTTYYVRAYAANSAGTAYGNEVSFTTSWACGDPITDSRDSKTYNTIQIGTQCWFAQNLNVGTRVNGSSDLTDNSILEKYCYSDSESNCDIYGGLYQWAEMVQYLDGASNTTSWNPVPTGNVVGMCPTGWHLPSDAEWTSLATFLGGTATAGGKMKETGTTHWLTPNTGATNSSGFTGLASGVRNTSVSHFEKMGEYAPFYSSTESSPTNMYIFYLYCASENMTYAWHYKNNGLPVRCLKD